MSFPSRLGRSVSWYSRIRSFSSTLVYGTSEKSLDPFNTFDILVEPGVPNLDTTFQKRTYIHLIKTHKDRHILGTKYRKVWKVYRFETRMK